jgi:CheY-like chemotaxis protein
MPKTAILIDDDRDDLEFLEEAIKKIDDSVTCLPYLYCDEALNVISTDTSIRPNYIFIDMNMPKLNGHECLKQLRKNPNFDRVTITMFSTSMPPVVAKQLRENGANFTFQKPNKFAEYRYILENILL